MPKTTKQNAKTQNTNKTPKRHLRIKNALQWNIYYTLQAYSSTRCSYQIFFNRNYLLPSKHVATSVAVSSSSYSASVAQSVQQDQKASKPSVQRVVCVTCNICKINEVVAQTSNNKLQRLETKFINICRNGCRWSAFCFSLETVEHQRKESVWIQRLVWQVLFFTRAP